MDLSRSERLGRNLDEVRARIVEAARRAGRAPDSAKLVAVTKQSDAAIVAHLPGLGQLDCGENYPQHLWSKAEALDGLGIRWHMIGHLQSNKARKTLPLVRLVHGVDSLRLLEATDEIAAKLDLPDPPGLCLQVNTSAEPSKHGWDPETILADADQFAAPRRCPIVGLMTMAAWGTDAESARPSFARLRELRDELARRTGLALPELSMGMSNDYEAAVVEGATLVRVGSAIFEGIA